MTTWNGSSWTGAVDVASQSSNAVACASPTFCDVAMDGDVGVASLREHRASIDGLGTDFDPSEFLRNMAGFGGMAAGCEMAVLGTSMRV